MTNFNLGAALAAYKENAEITVLDRGTYLLECTSAKPGTASKGATITPVFKVASGPHAGSRVMAGKMSFAETAMWKTVPQLHGFGLSDDFLQQAASTPDPIKTVADAMVGRVVEATLDIDNWQGEDRNKLSKVAAPQAGGGQSGGVVAPPPPPSPPAAPQPPAPPQPGQASPTPSF